MGAAEKRLELGLVDGPSARGDAVGEAVGRAGVLSRKAPVAAACAEAVNPDALGV